MTTTSTQPETATEASVEEPPAPPVRRRRRGRVVLAVVVVVALAAAAAAWAVVGTSGGEGDADAATATTPRSTARVRTQDIVSTTELSGTLTYADSTTVAAGGTGTITWLPEVGAVVEPGQTVYEVDETPVVLLPGTVPFWRDLAEGVDDGRDVQALEQALVDLGYADGYDLSVDEEFTSVTGDVVEVFREAVGLSDEDDGDESLRLGEVVVADGALRVAGTDVALGTQVSRGAAVMTATSPDRVVTVSLDAADQGVVAEGDTVDVELPDGEVVTGDVTYVSPVARAVTSGGQNAETSYVLDVEITLGEGGEGWDEAPVDVEVTDQVATGVLAVPVEALLALAEGGYALEVVDADGSTHLIPVELGDFADGWVAVSGPQVEDGLEVVTA